MPPPGTVSSAHETRILGRPFARRRRRHFFHFEMAHEEQPLLQLTKKTETAENVYPLPWFGSPVQERHRCSVDAACRHALPDKDRGGGATWRVILGVLGCIIVFLLIIVSITPKEIFIIDRHYQQLCDPKVQQETLFLSNAFVWYFHPRVPKSERPSPVVFWLGSGELIQSSLAEVVSGNGPCLARLVGNTVGTEYNEYALINSAHVVYVDYPDRVGYSTASVPNPVPSFGQIVHEWLQQHPELKSHPIYLFGNGIQTPYVLHAADDLLPLLTGIAIGNGHWVSEWTPPPVSTALVPFQKFYDSSLVREVLRIPSTSGPWQATSTIPSMSRSAAALSTILNSNLKVLLYYGDHSNWQAGDAWLAQQSNWTLQNEYQDLNWTAEHTKTLDTVTFARILDANHWPAHTQRIATFHLLSSFLRE